MKALRKLISKALTRDRKKALERLKKKPFGTFSTDKFYNKGKGKSKTLRNTAIAAGGTGAVGGAVSAKTKSKAESTGNQSIVKAANAPDATNKGIKKLIKVEKKNQDYDKKRKAESDLIWEKSELKKGQSDIRPQVGGGKTPQEVSRSKQAKERKQSIKKSNIAQKEIKDFVEGKRGADWEKKNYGALTGSEKRMIKRRAKPGETIQQAHARMSKSEAKRKTTKKQNATASAIAAEDKRLAQQNPSWSKVYRASIAKKNVANRNKVGKQEAVKKTRVIGDTSSLRGDINEKAGRPREGTKRMRAKDRIGDKHKFDPDKKTKNTKKILDEKGNIVTPKSNVKGTAKQEAHISGQAAKRKKILKASKLLTNKKKPEDVLKKYENKDPNAEVSPEDLKKIARSMYGKLKKDDKPSVYLSEDMQFDEKLGALAGGAVGAELTRRYLRDVKLRHELNKNTKKNRKWKQGKVPLYGNKAPKGFRSHVGTRALARLLTPVAIGGSIGYGIKKRKEHSK